jgi:riboflavin transporter FmnP
MNARSIALITTFAAIAIALNTIRIPTIYWPGFSYHFSEIPIVVAFLLFGPTVGVLVDVLHIAGQLLFFPVGPVGSQAFIWQADSLLAKLDRRSLLAKRSERFI